MLLFGGKCYTPATAHRVAEVKHYLKHSHIPTNAVHSLYAVPGEMGGWSRVLGGKVEAGDIVESQWGRHWAELIVGDEVSNLGREWTAWRLQT